MPVFNPSAANPSARLQEVVDLPTQDCAALSKLLTFDSLPTEKDLGRRAHEVKQLVREVFEKIGFDADVEEPIFMVGGAPFFMPVLAQVLEDCLGGRCLYAFSQRVSVESADGTKTSVFKHLGFVPHVRE